jgi:hypothetical protein
MRWLSFVASFALIVAVSTMGVGCKKAANNNTTTTGGDGKYTLTKPDDVTIKQGEKKDVTVKVERKGDFKDEVKLTISDLPDGVKAEKSEVTVAKDAKEATFTLKADDAAKEGDGTPKIKGSPGDATISFKVSVKKK